MIFVDTSVWFAAHVVEDVEHAQSLDLLVNATSDLVTTDYVVDELLTLLVARNQREVAVRIGENLWSEQICKLIWVSEDDVRAAWKVFLSFNDKKWSFTDCVSFAVMKRLGITGAFSLDDDFRQFGFASVSP
jgi:predicted nucleic acid-binding protein